MTKIVLALLTGLFIVSAEARELRCESYSKQCEFTLSINASSASLRVTRSRDCEISPGQTITLAAAQDDAPGYSFYQGEDRRDRRVLQLRFEKSEIAKRDFSAMLNISLTDSDMQFVENQISCE